MQSVNVMTFYFRSGAELTIQNPVAADAAHHGVTIRDADGFEYCVRLEEVIATKAGAGVLPEIRIAALGMPAEYELAV